MTGAHAVDKWSRFAYLKYKDLLMIVLSDRVFKLSNSGI